MKQKHIILIVISVIIGTLGMTSLIYVGAWIIAPGSYPRAEIYNFDIPEDSLIAIINEVKAENPELNLTKKVRIPNGGNFYLSDGRKDSTDYWHSIYFYYPDKNKILHTWTRPKNEKSTNFAFVGINNGLTIGNWKTVNGNFWWWKNQPDIDEFEKRILDKIKEKTKPNN